MRSRLALVLGISLLVVGCAEPPENESAQARAAVLTAEEAEAPKYAAAELREAQNALSEAATEVETQNERFAILRDYDDAREMLASTMLKAENARAKAVEAKAAAKVEAESRLAAARAAITGAGEALKKAPRGKGTRADINALSADLDGVRAAAEEVAQQVSDEEYFAARDKADGVITAANSIAEEIKAAIEMQAKLMRGRR